MPESVGQRCHRTRESLLEVSFNLAEEAIHLHVLLLVQLFPHPGQTGQNHVHKPVRPHLTTQEHWSVTLPHDNVSNGGGEETESIKDCVGPIWKFRFSVGYEQPEIVFFYGECGLSPTMAPV